MQFPLKQDYLEKLGNRKESCRAYLMNLVEDGFEHFGRGEWQALVKAHNRALNGDKMEE